VKNKKVAFITEIPTFYREPLFEKLSQRQNLSIEVIYCAYTEYGRQWKQELKNYPYKVLGGLKWTMVGNGDNIFVLKVNPGIWNQLSRGGFDAVIIGGYMQPTMQMAILWCLLNRVPYILWSESHNITPRPILKRILKWPIVKLAIKMAAAFLVMGSDSRNYLISYGANPAKIFFFPNTPDVKKLAEESSNYRKDIERLRTGLRIQGSPVIIYSGRLIGYKNVETLLRAFQLVQEDLPQTGLIILGDGPLRSSLENFTKKLKLSNVCFVGFIQPKDLIKYYACSDVFVLSSYSDTWGVVVLEAMSCGLPVVVSDKVGCAKDIVHPNKSGFVVSVKSTKELALAISKLLHDPLLCKQMGSYAREIAMERDYDFSIQQLIQALNIATNENVK